MAAKAKPDTAVPMTIEELAADVNKKHGKEVIVLGNQVSQVVPRLSTGILSLDLALGGGWASNQWNEVVGVESSGKTAICYHTIAYNQALDPEFTAMFVAAEEFVPSYAQAIGVDLDRIWVVESNEMEFVFDLTVRAVEHRMIDMLVIDSLPALVTDAEAERTMIEGQLVSPGAKIISTFFKKMSKAARRSLKDPNDRPCTLIMINQWRDVIGQMFGDPNITPGGKAKNYHFFVRLEVARDEWIKTGSDLTTRIGQTIAVRTFKNKTHRAQQRAQMDFYFADGAGMKKGEFDRVKDIVNVALSLELFEGRYKYEGVKIASTKDELPGVVRQDLDLQRKLLEAAHRAVLPHLFDEIGGANDEQITSLEAADGQD